MPRPQRQKRKINKRESYLSELSVTFVEHDVKKFTLKYTKKKKKNLMLINRGHRKVKKGLQIWERRVFVLLLPYGPLTIPHVHLPRAPVDVYISFC